ncbi:MAG: hypothetical protein PEGG_01777 [Paraeggerthella hongkongensis]|uniref:type II toxin-antitoxin system Phd/YefM family antitoxin n=1 Tax=Paraeggerthella TaxID=651554 RepID=UPI001C118D4C|nr:MULTISPECIES: type II toxin-antitoxin system Phd/YefM family antitoxin [Paraeggerthella]MBU5405279.1 type II toxin-antitoxin system Phd/YefM family antitoxin [Paraeggerthella hongkongensis]MCD2433352.1 type II toxin-antitoxin system Phd/YefM family antitoxin [Paraeggerthella hominis]
MPSPIAPLPVIRPITDLRTQPNNVCTQAAERRNRAYLALREAEIEEQYRPETLSAEESDARLREIFALRNLDYAPVGNRSCSISHGGSALISTGSR